MQLISIFKDYSNRTLLINIFSSLCSFIFLLYTVGMVILLQSMWYLFLVLYYTILLVMRFIILYIFYKNARFPQEEKYSYYLKVYRVYGGFFLFLVVFFSSIILSNFKVYLNHKLNMPLLLFSGYAIIKFAFAIYNIFKAYKVQNPFVQILRNLSFLDACMTLYLMQSFVITAILGENAHAINIHYITELCGGILLALLTAGIGLNMIFTSSKKLKEFATNKKIQYKKRR